MTQANHNNTIPATNDYNTMIDYEALANQTQDVFEGRVSHLIKSQKYAVSEFLNSLVSTIVLPAVGSKYSHMQYQVVEDMQQPIKLLDEDNVMVSSKTFLFLGGTISSVLLIAVTLSQHFGPGRGLFENKDFNYMMRGALNNIGMVYEEQTIARAIIRNDFNMPEDMHQ